MPYVTLPAVGEKVHVPFSVNTDERVQGLSWVAEGGALVAKAEDSGHVSGDFGVPMLLVRNDAMELLAGTDKDYIMASTDASGRVLVNAATATQPVNVLSGDVSLVSHLNSNFTVHVSQPRTTEQANENTNLYHRGVILYLNVTVITNSWTPRLEFYDVSTGGSWRTVHQYPDVSTVATHVYYVHPDPPGTLTVTFAANSTVTLPRTWRLRLTPSNTNSTTYSLGGQYLL